ncbi:MAG: NAD(P)/FAD-dependent oxidoreductase [Amphritea sp.]|nr:NAD(P)/FAD-dependent oxidoreductase [Amphritea sp.]MBQ0783222.1 NAD(P)/FAD-dependent oxidoreductase [Amphritea sp.]
MAAGATISRLENTAQRHEGYLTADLTLDGIDINEVSSKTFEVGAVFVGECIDVTGHLDGHDYHWAWTSSFGAGEMCN